MRRRPLVWLIALAVVGLAVAIAIAGRGSGSESDSGGPDGGQPTAEREAKRPVADDPPRKVSGPHDRPVPVLMYHAVTAPPPDAPYPELYVRAADFTRQMRHLAKRGYNGVTLRHVHDYWRRAVALPRRPIVVSFDDGYQSIHANALPVLRDLDWPGVVLLEVANMTPSWGLEPSKVRALIAAGWELGSHSLSHPDLTKMGAAQLRREVAGSRRLLRRRFDIPVDFFSYPSGRYDDAAVAAVRAAGYRGAVTTDNGLAKPSEPFTLERIRVNGSDGPHELDRKLRAVGG